MRKATLRWLALSASMVVLACSDSGTPAEPLAPTTPQFASASSEEARTRHEALKDAMEERRAQIKAMKEATKDELKAARAEWKAWKEDWKEKYKLAKEVWKREHPGQKGGPEIQLLRCEPKPYDADVAIIGPKGGTLHVGEHELVIPEGALAEEQLITAEAPTSSMVDVRFEPHGLEFLKSAQLTLSYKGCVRPTSSDFLVAYLGQGNQILELPPSTDHKATDDVEADIDHFSRYAIAW